jgi:1L-myo-inositol 1-phosphate cytidylyltransferase
MIWPPRRSKTSSLCTRVIETAIVLAAGEGSRLRSAAPLKPLCTVASRTLLDHVLAGLATAGVKRVVVVLGYGAEQIEAHLAAGPAPLIVETVRTDHRQPNGVSALAAWPRARGDPALLVMCDHLVDPALYRRVAVSGSGAGAKLAVDRRLRNPRVDLADVTRVQTAGERIVTLGKGIEPYDCFDTGVFAVGPELFAALDALPSPSLSQGVASLAAAGKASIIDCSDLEWIDVDDARALDDAEQWQRELLPTRKRIAS